MPGPPPAPAPPPDPVVRPAAGPPAEILVVQLALVAATGLAIGLTFARVFEQPADLVMPMAVTALTAAAFVAGLSVWAGAGRRRPPGWRPSPPSPPLATIVVTRAAPPTPVAVGRPVTALHGPRRAASCRSPCPWRRTTSSSGSPSYATVVAAGELSVRRRAPAGSSCPWWRRRPCPRCSAPAAPPPPLFLLVALVVLLGALVLVRGAPAAVPEHPIGRAGRHRDRGGPTRRRPPPARAPCPSASPCWRRWPCCPRPWPPWSPAPTTPASTPGRSPAGSVPETLDDPLAMVTAQLGGTPAPRCRPRSRAPPACRCSAPPSFDRYDGVSFRPTLLPAPAGSSLPPPAEPPPPGSQPVVPAPHPGHRPRRPRRAGADGGRPHGGAGAGGDVGSPQHDPAARPGGGTGGHDPDRRVTGAVGDRRRAGRGPATAAAPTPTRPPDRSPRPA